MKIKTCRRERLCKYKNLFNNNAAISTIRSKLYDFRSNIYYFNNNIYIVTTPRFQKNKKQCRDFVNSFKVARLQKQYIYYFSSNIYCMAIYIPAAIYIVTTPRFRQFVHRKTKQIKTMVSHLKRNP